MRTFTKEHTVYKFSELSRIAKDKVIEDYQNDEWENGLDWLEDDMVYHLEELFKEYGITDKGTEIRYSFSYSQGDGASFEGEIEWKSWRATVSKNHWGNRYTHYNSVEVSEMTSLKTDKDAPDKTVEKLNEIVKEIGKRLEIYGYNCIEGFFKEENIAEMLEDAEFYADGRRHYE